MSPGPSILGSITSPSKAKRFDGYISRHRFGTPLHPSDCKRAVCFGGGGNSFHRAPIQQLLLDVAARFPFRPNMDRCVSSSACATLCVCALYMPCDCSYRTVAKHPSPFKVSIPFHSTFRWHHSLYGNPNPLIHLSCIIMPRKKKKMSILYMEAQSTKRRGEEEE